MDLILQKKRSLSEFTYFHACCSHYFKYNFYKFADTVFRWQIERNPLSVCTYSPSICRPFYTLHWKRSPLRLLSCSDEDGFKKKKKWKSSQTFFFFCDRLVCLCETRGQLLLHGWNNLNVNASRLARCKIITVSCVLAIRCRSLCTLLDCL